MTEDKKILLIEKEIKVATYDIDFAGIVSNISYIRWLEDLRLVWLEKYFSLDKQAEAGFAPILPETRIEYHHAIRMFDQPTGLMWVDRLHSHKWQIKAEIGVKDKVMAIAEQKGVFVDRDKWKPVRIPENLKQLYLKEKGNGN
ncbi:MAG: acyl-CoA thioesterase [Candidatus Atribacteria bacterium]|nr:acyl-CoA thioesterase [Candidatus Atribacteria bacterium]